MINFLLSLIPASLTIYAIHILFQEGNLLEKQGDWITEKLGEKWSKPVINCTTCMASVWGTLIFFIGLPVVFGINHAFKYWIPYVFCLCGWHVILAKFTTKERIIVEE